MVGGEPVSWEMLTIVVSVGASMALSGGSAALWISRLKMDIAVLKERYENRHEELEHRVNRLEGTSPYVAPDERH